MNLKLYPFDRKYEKTYKAYLKALDGTDVLAIQETHKALHEALKALQNKLNEGEI